MYLWIFEEGWLIGLLIDWLIALPAIPEAPQGRVMLGVQIHMGLEVKAKDLTHCIKKCANAGKGVQARAITLSQQLCFGIDYDFSNHK